MLVEIVRLLSDPSGYSIVVRDGEIYLEPVG
jgi:hypothetical protein